MVLEVYVSSLLLVLVSVNCVTFSMLKSFISYFSIVNRLAIAKEGQLAICTIDEKQKLHIIHSEHLGEYVRYISHQEQSRTIAICSITYEGGNQTYKLVRLFDDQTFQRKSTYIFDQFEYGCSILSCSFSDDNNVYYCVGTAYVMPNQNELTKVSQID